MNLGRTGQIFVKKEGTYADPAVTFAATDALRHVSLGEGFSPFNREVSPEKTAAAGVATRLDRRQTAELSALECLIRPSGTLNTVPEADEIYECAFGARTNVTLATTVSSAGSATGAVVASAGALAVGDAVLLTRNSVNYVRWLTVVAGTTLAWEPALPTAIVNGETVKGCITYKLTTSLALSLAFAHYLTDFHRLLLGVGADKFGMVFDANLEPRFSLSGPAADQKTGVAVPAQPGAFTSVGGNPPSGMVGEMIIGAGPTAYKFKKLAVSIENTLKARADEYGVAVATEVYRNGRRNVTISLESYAQDQAALYDLAAAGTPQAVMKQTGRTQGNIIAVRLPKVDFDVPSTDDPDEAVSWAFTGTALCTADGLNDECVLAIA